MSAEMLRALKFVQGAVAKKDFLPAMTHFAIEKGTVRAYNGALALSSEIPFDIDCKPKAAPLVQAISNCKETVSLSMTPAGRLSIKSGAFKAFIDCVQEDTPHVLPEGKRIDFNGERMLQAFKTVAPFIGDDASRPWATGVLLRGECAYATNNVMLVEYWAEAEFPIVVNVPRVAIREMLRIDDAPTHAQVTDNSMTFHYADNRWVRTQLLQTEWPDLKRILDRESTQLPLDPELFDGLDKIKPFADAFGRVYVSKGKIGTTNEESEGAHFDLPSIDWEGIYSIEMLKLLRGVAKTVDFTGYPNPCLFIGDNNQLRGAIIGMKC